MSIRQPVSDRVQRFVPSSQVSTLPAPAGGWNARDNLANMDPLDAITMDNFKATTGGISLRKGNTLYADAVTGQVETLFEYESATDNDFIAVAGTVIYTITGGTVTSQKTLLTNARWQCVNFNGIGFMVNGSDTPQEWDGTSIADTGWTGAGLTVTDLINVSVARGRLWFVEKDTAMAWYGGSGAVTGTLLQFDIGQIARAGHLVAVGTWSRDSGDGQDDLTVFVMSTGQIAVYENDVAANFSLIGIYEAPRPIGRRCLMNIGGELIIITRGGYMALSALMRGGFGPEATISDKIRGAVSDATAAGSTLFGWEGINHPDGINVFFNVPNSTTDFDQHVLNTVTGAWSRYKDWDSSCFGVFAGEFFMGIEDQVYKLDQGGVDNSRSAGAAGENWEDLTEQWDTWGLVYGGEGVSISGTCIQASNALDGTGNTKQVMIARPTIKIADGVSVTIAALSNYDTTVPASNLQTLTPGATGIAHQNFSVHATGTTFSIAMTIETAEEIAWYDTDLVWRPGGFL